jgi:hypothetical protein
MRVIRLGGFCFSNDGWLNGLVSETNGILGLLGIEHFYKMCLGGLLEED